MYHYQSGSSESDCSGWASLLFPIMKDGQAHWMERNQSVWDYKIKTSVIIKPEEAVSTGKYLSLFSGGVSSYPSGVTETPFYSMEQKCACVVDSVTTRC